MKNFALIALLSLLTAVPGMAQEAPKVPDFMQSFVIDETNPESKQKIAIENVLTLNNEMFNVYDKSLGIYKTNFLKEHPLIMALFSGKGGRFILYRPGKPPLEAESVPLVYQIAKSVGHTAMATFVLLAPYTSNPSADLGWLGSLKTYRVDVQTALESLDAIDLKPEVRDLLRDTLQQIATFMDSSIQKSNFTYDELLSFGRNIKPNLAKLIDVSTHAQVGHWWAVMEEWKKMLGPDWEKTYGLSNSIYVARQNNILFSILVQFFGEQAINDRLMLLETTDFTTTPELMMDAFMRIVSDRLIGEVFYKNLRLMDFELLGGSARKTIEEEAEKHGVKAVLPPKVPFNTHGWPWKTDASTGTGPSSMDEIH